MPYKRRLRLLFVSAGGAVARDAAAVAATRAGGWVEARTAGAVAAGGASPARPDPAIWDPAARDQAGADPAGPDFSNWPDLKDWADLVITLDESARRALPVLPARVRHRHWPLDAEPGAGRPEAIAARLDGVVGGLRLLARST